MRGARVHDAHRMLHLALLALGAGVLWILVSLFAQSSASHAAEGDSGSGLLGAVTSTLNPTTDAVATTIGAVDRAVASVVPEDVVPAPAPVAEPVTKAVHRTTAVVARAVRTVDLTAGSVVTAVTEQVSEAASRTPLAPVVGAPAPVAPLLPAVPTQTVDVLLETLFPPSIEESATPPVVAPAVVVTGRVGALAEAAAPASASVASATRGDALVTIAAVVVRSALPVLPGLPAPPSEPAGSVQGSVNGTGLLALSLGMLGALFATRRRRPASWRRSTLPADDALPGAPVYATDTSPD